MNRRKFLATLDTAAAGTSAVVSTGAFTSVSADRGVEVDVAGDKQAYVGLEPASGPSGDYARTEGGQLAVRLGKVNDDALTRVEDVFVVRNRGTQKVGFRIDKAGDFPEAVTFIIRREERKSGENQPPATYVPRGNGVFSLANGGTVGLEVGEDVPIGVRIDTRNGDAAEATGERHPRPANDGSPAADISAGDTLLDSVTIVAKDSIGGGANENKSDTPAGTPNARREDGSSLQANGR